MQAKVRAGCGKPARPDPWRGSGAILIPTPTFRLFPGSIRSPQGVEFLEHLLRHLPEKLLIIWDGLRSHRSRMVWDFVRQQRGRVWLEFPPAYAPELNPVEYLWSHWKQHELPNFCPQTFRQLSRHARRALRRMRCRPTLVMAFWAAGRTLSVVSVLCESIIKRPPGSTPAQALRNCRLDSRRSPNRGTGLCFLGPAERCHEPPDGTTCQLTTTPSECDSRRDLASADGLSNFEQFAGAPVSSLDTPSEKRLELV
jgi:transposase